MHWPYLTSPYLGQDPESQIIPPAPIWKTT